MLCVSALILFTMLSCIVQCVVMYFIVLCVIVLCFSGNTVDSCSMYLCTVFFCSTFCCKYCKVCYIENNVVCLVVVILTVLCPTKI